MLSESCGQTHEKSLAAGEDQDATGPRPRLAFVTPCVRHATPVSRHPHIFTAGACPLDGDGQVVAPGDVAGQTRRALHNLQVALNEADCQPEDVLKTTVFVASSSRDDLLAAWREYESLDGNDGPPSTLLGVAVLGWPEQLVEIEAIAVRR